MDRYDRFLVLLLTLFFVPPSGRPYFTQMALELSASIQVKHSSGDNQLSTPPLNIDNLSVAKSHIDGDQLRD